MPAPRGRIRGQSLALGPGFKRRCASSNGRPTPRRRCAACQQPAAPLACSQPGRAVGMGLACDSAPLPRRSARATSSRSAGDRRAVQGFEPARRISACRDIPDLDHLRFLRTASAAAPVSSLCFAPGVPRSGLPRRMSISTAPARSLRAISRTLAAGNGTPRWDADGRSGCDSRPEEPRAGAPPHRRMPVSEDVRLP